jgi:hypothetical protein
MGIGISDDQLQDVLILAVAWHGLESREYKVEHGQEKGTGEMNIIVYKGS